MYPSPIQGFVVASDFDDAPALGLKNVLEPRSLPKISTLKQTSPSALHALHTHTVETHLGTASDSEPSPISPISPKRSFSPPQQSHVPQVWNRRYSESSASSDRPLRRFSFDTDAYQRQRRQSVQSQGPVLKWLRKATVFLVEIFDEADPLEPEEEFPAPSLTHQNYRLSSANNSAIESDSDTELEKIKSRDSSNKNTSTSTSTNSTNNMEIISTGKRVYNFFSERPHWLGLLAIFTALPLSSHVVYEWLQWAVIGSAVLLGPTYTAGFYPVLGFVSLGFMVNFPAQVCAFGLLLWLAREWHTVEVMRKSKLTE
ncbi:hypothetical protein B0I72DRAFT_94482 [Yarrowia lipolytica]|jgi:hypothetical protein|uniref:YALI0F00946p n=3 Tax=Yarrowia lipolytica TaxID=4952 RepID=Q6C3C0_YARLI|nr:YALI0F00946p [Yarrowia lipolytica CLIB122]KAB8280879.1 hypothetical protein BKA91DRAFT_175413 [Yarrowia lipolytica]KAE8170157.1 hypothetical protein BKA90DRAFT_176071 [Yarrowia lipolytica]KAJ8056278.1 hypothetical protein LXG23DRAFT_18133 [Yarrowia lipolytica]RDW25385.1 hypothetical protein B0I71DRAFT_159440 [Yarrowia lipolytica]RDW33957.1 hypothetical protein B0I72DRAFT_94482 [Yarrowia lipolytica]|eukprot:XP_504842.1 YALI0F00946p [Yarrowia lipolytica CLIB122]